MDILLYVLIGFFVLAIVIGLAVANFAGENLLTIYDRYSRQNISFLNTIEFANIVSTQEFNGKIKSRVIDGILTDNYSNKVISLSKNVAYGNNVSAFAVCAHELGHALQYRDTPKKMRRFSKTLVFCKIVSKLSLPIFLIGIPLIFWNIIYAVIIFGVGVLTFLIGLFAKLSTIKIESEASEKALELLSKYADFDEDSVKQAKKVLSAAKLTYVASFLKSVLSWTMLVRRYDFY